MTTAVSFLQQQGDSINVLLIAVKRPDVWDEKRLSILVYRDNSMQANTRPTTGHNIYLSIYLSICLSVRPSVRPHTHTHIIPTWITPVFHTDSLDWRSFWPPLLIYKYLQQRKSVWKKENGICYLARGLLMSCSAATLVASSGNRWIWCPRATPSLWLWVVRRLHQCS